MHVSCIAGKDHTVVQLQTCATLTNSHLPSEQQDVAVAFNNSAEDYQQVIEKMMLDKIIIQWRNDILTSQPEEQAW